MKPVLIGYASNKGTTRRVVEHLAATLRALGSRVEVSDVRQRDDEQGLSGFAAVVVVASVAHGIHEIEAIRFLKTHRADLEKMPTSVVSVRCTDLAAEETRCKSTVIEAARQAAHADVSKLFVETGWRPEHVELVACATVFTRCGFFVRLSIRLLSRKRGLVIDTSHDVEFTDWSALEHFAQSLLEVIPAPHSIRRGAPVVDARGASEPPPSFR